MKKLFIGLLLLSCVTCRSNITLINTGTEIDDPTSDSIYAAFIKCNNNFQNLYTNLQGFTNQVMVLSNQVYGLSNQVYGLTTTWITNSFSNLTYWVNVGSNNLNVASNALYTTQYNNDTAISNLVVSSINNSSNALRYFTNQNTVINLQILTLTTYTQNTLARLPINVKWYGALGDGINDDAGNIQAAIDAATNGGSVYFPPGTYAIGSPVNIIGKTNFVFYGDNVVISNKNTTSWTANSAMFYFASNSNINIKGFSLIGNNTNATYNNEGMYFTYCYGTVLENISISKCGSLSFYALNSVGLNGRNINITLCTNAAAYTGFALSVQDFIFDNLTIDGNCRNSTTLALGNNAVLQNCSNGKFNNLYSFDGVVNELMLQACTNITIRDSYLVHSTNAITTTLPCLYVTSSSENISLNNVTLNGNAYNSTANKQGYGLSIVGGRNYSLNNCTITNCWIGMNFTTITNLNINGGNFNRNALALQTTTSRDIKVEDSTFDYCGYNYGTSFTNFFQPYRANINLGFAIAIRHASSFVTFNNCSFNYSGRDGANVNQGSHDVSFYNCRANHNWDGGYTLSADVSSPGTLGDGISPYNISYYSCEAFNNFGSGLASYYPAYTVNIHGGKYFNNHRAAGEWTDDSSMIANIYFAAGSKNITIKGVKLYDDRQLVFVNTYALTNTTELLITFTNNWKPEFTNLYPIVTILSGTNTFLGYAKIISCGSNYVYLKQTTNNTYDTSTIIARLGTKSRVTQRTLSFGAFFDHYCSGSVDYDTLYGFIPTTLDPKGIFSSYIANYQNIKLQSGTLISPNIAVDPEFNTDTNLSYYTTAYNGYFNVNAGTNTWNPPAYWCANAALSNSQYAVAYPRLNINKAQLQGCFVSFGAWVYSDLPMTNGTSRGIYLQTDWTGSTASSRWHPGDSRWHWLEVNGLFPGTYADIQAAPFKFYMQAPADNTVRNFYVGSIRVIVTRADYENSLYDTYNSYFNDSPTNWIANP